MQKKKFSDNSRIKPRHNGGTEEKLRNVPSRIFNILSFLSCCSSHPSAPSAEHKKRMENDDAWLLVGYTVPNAMIHFIHCDFSFSVSRSRSEFHYSFFRHRFAASSGSNKLGEHQTKRISRTLWFALCLFVRTKHTERAREMWQNLVRIKIVGIGEMR